MLEEMISKTHCLPAELKLPLGWQVETILT